MLRKLWLEYRPSTLYYKYVQYLYAQGVRPKPGKLFYSAVLEKEALNMGGKFVR